MKNTEKSPQNTRTVMTEEEKRLYRAYNPMSFRLFTFGKYKGKRIREIIVTDLQYVKWCVENVTFFSLSDDEKELFNEVEHQIIVDRSKMKNFKKKYGIK